VEKERLAGWVRAAAGGDDVAFSRLVRAHQNLAVAFAMATLGDYQLAEDVAQEAFVEAYRRLDSLREPAAFRTWFRTILVKYCDRMMRRKRLSVIGLEAAMEIASAEPSPLDSLESQANAATLQNAMGSLTDAERTVALLYYMGEHSYAAVAEMIDVPTNVVKTRLYSARRRLRTHMSEIEQNLQVARPSNDSRFAQRVMAHSLPLQLYTLDSSGDKHASGSTAASRTAPIPDSNAWLVQPRGTFAGAEWDGLLGLIQEMQIPGLSANGQMTDDLLERVSRLDSIQSLDLEGCTSVTDDGLKHLARMPQLRHLNLTCPAMTDRGLEVLGSLTQLETLKIFHVQSITDAGLKPLAACDGIRNVNLLGTHTGDGVLHTLAGKRQLSHLYPGNAVTDAGLAILKEFPVFTTQPTGASAWSLLTDIGHPNYLWLNLKSPITDQGIASLASLTGLRALNLFGGTGSGPFDASRSGVTPAGLRRLTSLPNLQWLGCTASLCTDKAMRSIADMADLKFLMCQDTVAGDNGFAELSRSSSIENIWGRRCYGISDRGFAALADMPALRGLSVSCKNVGDAGLSALPRFPALREFMPMDVSDDGFRHVGHCRHLEALHCMYCPETTDAATQNMAGLTGLKVYGAWGTQIGDASLRVLGQLPLLERLTFYQCDRITNDGLQALAGLKRLVEVNLERLANVSDDAAAIFPANVRVNFLS